MTESLLDQQYLSLPDAARLVPPDSVHVMTVIRWSRKGVRGHVLKTVKIGGRRLTTKPWLSAFLLALQDSLPQSTSKPRTSASKELDELLDGKPAKRRTARSKSGTRSRRARA